MTLLVAAMAIAASAQGVKKVSVLADGSQEMITTSCCYARSNGLFSKHQEVAMSQVVLPTDSVRWCIVLPLVVKQKYEIAEGSRLRLKLQNGTTVSLPCANSVTKMDNRAEMGNTYTITPRYAITEEQIGKLSQWEVESLSLETTNGNIDIDSKDYSREWRFGSIVQRCHNVLKWKLDELRGM